MKITPKKLYEMAKKENKENTPIVVCDKPRSQSFGAEILEEELEVQFISITDEKKGSESERILLASQETF